MKAATAHIDTQALAHNLSQIRLQAPKSKILEIGRAHV